MSTTVKKMLKEDIELKEHLIDNYWKLLQEYQNLKDRIEKIENKIKGDDDL